MNEMYRMLGLEHQADLDREALKWQRAAQVRRSPERSAGAAQRSKAVRFVPARVAALLARAARAET